MIDVACTCGVREDVPEAKANSKWLCPSCGKTTHLACAETLPADAGTGDFDASLLITSGPAYVGERYLLGGVADIELGKLSGKHVLLPGPNVSRNHCILRRLDYGPSRWQLVDSGSACGSFVNAERVRERELASGDSLTIGDFELKYEVALSAPEPAVAEFASMHTAATTPAPPRAPAIHQPFAVPTSHAAKRPAAGRLEYRAESESALLGDCDVNWVMKLRNASTLMVYSLIINAGASWIGFYTLQILAGIITAGMGVLAAWLLTSPEPGVANSWFSVRGLLRGFAIIACAGQILLGLQELFSFTSDTLLAVASILTIALLPQTALFLFYLRRLALRLPNPGLAFGAVVVMIGLPVFMGMGMYAAYRAASGGMTEALGTGLLAILGLLGMRLLYISLLIWFNKSFS